MWLIVKYKLASRKNYPKKRGLSAVAFQCNCSPGFSLQLLTTRSSWLRGFRFNPAAIGRQNCYEALPVG